MKLLASVFGSMLKRPILYFSLGLVMGLSGLFLLHFYAAGMIPERFHVTVFRTAIAAPIVGGTVAAIGWIGLFQLAKSSKKTAERTQGEGADTNPLPELNRNHIHKP